MLPEQFNYDKAYFIVKWECDILCYPISYENAMELIKNEK